jgi:hypothetical protein
MTMEDNKYGDDKYRHSNPSHHRKSPSSKYDYKNKFAKIVNSNEKVCYRANKNKESMEIIEETKESTQSVCDDEHAPTSYKKYSPRSEVPESSDESSHNEEDTQKVSTKQRFKALKGFTALNKKDIRDLDVDYSCLI